MQLSHVTAFWLRLAGNILLDLFLYVHMFCLPPLRARDYTTFNPSPPCKGGRSHGFLRTQLVLSAEPLVDVRVLTSFRGDGGDLWACDGVRRRAGGPVDLRGGAA